MFRSFVALLEVPFVIITFIFFPIFIVTFFSLQSSVCFKDKITLIGGCLGLELVNKDGF